jgi:hypothetical protein
VRGIDDVFVLQPRIGCFDTCDDLAADHRPDRRLHGNVGRRVQHHGAYARRGRRCDQLFEVTAGQRSHATSRPVVIRPEIAVDVRRADASPKPSIFATVWEE